MQYCQLITRNISENSRWQTYTLKKLKETMHENRFTSRPTMSGGDIWMVSVHPSVRRGFPNIIWKNNHSINFKFSVSICWLSVQNQIAFGRRWTNVTPLVALKRLKMGQNGAFQPLSEKSIQTIKFSWCTLVGFIKNCLREKNRLICVPQSEDISWTNPWQCQVWLHPVYERRRWFYDCT